MLSSVDRANQWIDSTNIATVIFYLCFYFLTILFYLFYLCLNLCLTYALTRHMKPTCKLHQTPSSMAPTLVLTIEMTGAKQC